LTGRSQRYQNKQDQPNGLQKKGCDRMENNMKALSEYKRVTINSIRLFVEARKSITTEAEFEIVNNFIIKVINQDKNYFNKLSKWREANLINNDDLNYLM
jgi:hypothetical protein